jgi:hypothetical protein
MIGAGDDDLCVEVEVRDRSDVGGDQVLVHIEKYLTLTQRVGGSIPSRRTTLLVSNGSPLRGRIGMIRRVGVRVRFG